MTSDNDEAMKFVLLIKEHQDVLIKSQKCDQKRKKAAAVDQILPKWAEISNKTLTQDSLFKKINNFKNRARLAQKSGKTLSEWQTFFLEIVGTEEHQSKLNTSSTVLPDKDTESVSSEVSSNETTKSKSVAEQFLADNEIEETRQLSNEQLQRFVLVKQAKVLLMQERRLERLERMDQLNSVVNEKDITFEYVGWEGANPKNIA